MGLGNDIQSTNVTVTDTTLPKIFSIVRSTFSLQTGHPFSIYSTCIVNLTNSNGPPQSEYMVPKYFYINLYFLNVLTISGLSSGNLSFVKLHTAVVITHTQCIQRKIINKQKFHQNKWIALKPQFLHWVVLNIKTR